MTSLRLCNLLAGVIMCVVATGCATPPLAQTVDRPLITYEKAIAAGIEHVRLGLCNNVYENISVEDLRLGDVEYVRTDQIDIVILTYELSDRAHYHERGGDVPIVLVYMTGTGEFLRCVGGHRNFSN